MKKVNRSSLFKLLVAFVLTGSVLLSACKKTDSGPNDTAAGLMAFNLIPDKASINVDISGNRLTNSPLLYTNYTGTYLPIFVGQREVSAVDPTTDSAFGSATHVFEANKYYSSFALGNNGVYTNIVVQDMLDTLKASGQAYVRYINAIPDSTAPNVTISSNATDIVNETAPYASVSNFHEVTPGDFNVKINNSTTIDANRSITLEKDKAYTILLVGVPGETDTAKSVQIKYITNGTITP